MKQIFYTLLLSIFFFSCKTSKDYLSKSDSDNTIFDAIKMIKKNSADSNALKALPVLYDAAKQRNLRKANSYSGSRDLSRWDKMINSYNTLQQMHDAIIDNDAASRMITPVNYQETIYNLKQQAAADYYNEGLFFLNKPARDDAKKAWNFFKKADSYVPGYRDATQKMEEAYDQAVVLIIINPVQDNSYFFNSGWGNYGINFSNEYFQQSLIRDLGGQNSSRYPARFYSDREASRNDIQPDWLIDLTLRNINIPRPLTNSYSRNVSKQVETGRDSSGKVIRQTVYATIHVTRRSFTARADMELNITDVHTRKNILFNTLREDYRWEEEHATYTGDSRALDANNWAIINNNVYIDPRREDILNELYRKLYPQVKSRISYAAGW